MSEFDDIRPYHDDEIQPVLKRVIADNEFLDLIGRLKFGVFYGKCQIFLRPLLKHWLLYRAAKVTNVFAFQMFIKKYLEKMIRTTTANFTVDGLSSLDPDKKYLFLSNHRDITMDPALTNYALYHEMGATVRIAIGDNLLSKPFASDLMRLNKSFIVRRSISKPRELFRELKKLSSYIWHSLKIDEENIWIAHREGRAKDGIDKTDSAIIKMLLIAKPKDQSFENYFSNLFVVPLSISYEFDPCDADKARELRIMHEGGVYVKGEHEDLDSIGKGLNGYKGDVHLMFGKPLDGVFEKAEDVAEALDALIVDQYKLHATNVLAYQKRYGVGEWDEVSSVFSRVGITMPIISGKVAQMFDARIDAVDVVDRPFFLDMYANPVVKKYEQHSKPVKIDNSLESN